MENKIISLNLSSLCGEKLNPITPSLNLKEIVYGKRFQFKDDRNRVREVRALDGEYILVETLGCVEDLPYYKCHYSHLKKNETEIENLK